MTYPPHRQVTKSGWSSSEASLGPPRYAAGLGAFLLVAGGWGSGPNLASAGRGFAATRARRQGQDWVITLRQARRYEGATSV